LAFGAGMASSVGNFTIMQIAQASPGDAPALRKVPPVLARVGQTGLIVLWITGLILVWSKFGGVEGLDWAFWAKLACVMALTALVAFMEMTMKKVRAGDSAAAAQLPLFGRIAAGLLLLIVIFAVVAFH
jgi:uncharacterized membrane protein